jgi:flagellar basal body-associated protein FliL
VEWAALITWLITAGGGFVLLAIWLKNGGMQQRERKRIRPAIILTHFALAAAGLVLWIAYVANGSKTLAWIAFALLLVVALIGFAMFGLWLTQRKRADHSAAEQRFPLPIVGLHGLLAATTLVLALLAAADIG